jgi:signal transduction histidine kinase
MLGHTRTALAGNVVIALTTIAVLVGSGVRDGVGLWAAWIFCLVGIRGLHARSAMRRLPALGEAGIARLEWGLTALLGASGIGWGLLPWLGYAGRDAFVDFFSVAMLVGMTGGAVTSTMAQPRALNTYLVAALVPFIVKSALMGGLVYLAGGLTICFSLAVLIAFGHTAHASLRHTIAVTRQNKRLVEAVRTERDAVQAAMRSKDLFLAGVTHDLRQPVHALGLHLRYLRKVQTDEATATRIDTICAPMDGALRAMSTQLSRLLELSRLEAGEAKVTRRGIPVADLFAACAAQFDALANEKGLRLRFRPSDAVVDSDPTMLQSILDNLVANAVRYTDAGRVLVVARRRDRTIELQVHDTGPGIEPDVIESLFEPYRRFDDRRDRAEEGQGLGLALVRKQADLLQHPVRVRSRVGRGSVFAVQVGEVMTAAFG